MTNDLVDRLRKQLSWASPNDRQHERPMSWSEAEKLLDRIEELEIAIGRIATYNPEITHAWAEDVREIARGALKGIEHE